MNPFVTFMSSTTGRLLRIAIGLALVAWGWFSLGGTTVIIVAVIGLLPLLAASHRRIGLVFRGPKSDEVTPHYPFKHAWR